MARCPIASKKWLLPVPLGPQTTRFSARPTHSRFFNPETVGRAIREISSSKTAKVLPVGRCERFLRASVPERDLPVTSAINNVLITSAGSQRCAFAVRRISGTCSRRYLSRSERLSAITSSSGECACPESCVISLIFQSPPISRCQPARCRHRVCRRRVCRRRVWRRVHDDCCHPGCRFVDGQQG